MQAEQFFKTMFFNIWQGHDLNRIDEFYARDFQEMISVADDKKKPIVSNLGYEDLVRFAHSYKENYQDVTIDIKKITSSDDQHISAYFYSSSVEKKTQELRHRWVCGIWHLNDHHKIDRVWAVVTPYYPE
jgi:hypothetical protein